MCADGISHSPEDVELKAPLKNEKDVSLCECLDSDRTDSSRVWLLELVAYRSHGIKLGGGAAGRRLYLSRVAGAASSL